MATTPSGLTEEEATKLSSQQKVTLPTEGSLVRVAGGEGAEDLFIKGTGNTLYTLDYSSLYPKDWGDKTIGYYKDLAAQQIYSAMGGKEQVPLLNAADFYGQYGGQFEKANVQKLSIGELLAKNPTLTTEQVGQSNILASMIAPDGSIKPEDTLAGVKSVFGQQWQPAPIFQEKGLVDKGIYGAVRIAGTNEVYTLGSGGRKETAESYLQRFGTSEQKGIVGEISKEQAIKLGITDTKQTPMPMGAISPEQLKEAGGLDISGVSEIANLNKISSDSVTAQAFIEEQIKLTQETESQKEKDLEKKGGDINTLIEELITEKGDIAKEKEARLVGEVDPLKKQQDEIDGRIRLKMAEVNALDTTYSSGVQFIPGAVWQPSQVIEGKPITMASIQGQTTQNYKSYLAQRNSMLAEALILQAQSDGLQGKITTATEAIDRAINLKYALNESETDIRVRQYKLVREKANEEQKIRLDALAEYNKQVQATIKDQKDRELLKYKSLLDLQSKYVDAGIELDTDTIESANAKIQSRSAIYQEQVRPPQYTTTPTITPEEVSPEIETLAQAYLRGESLGSIGATKKAQVIQRAEQIKTSPEYKEQIKIELRGDIQSVVDKKDYTVREDIINRLVPLYSELTLDEIAAEVYSMIPDELQVKESMWERLFGGLIK